MYENNDMSVTQCFKDFETNLIHWLKDGNSLPTSLRFSTNYVVPTGLATLTVTGALQIDCGNYTAVAENPAGKAYTTSQVFIKESSGVDTSAISNPDAFKYLNRPQTHGKYESAEDSQTDDDVPLNRAKPPRVIHHLQNIRQLEGEPVTMACKIDGFPKPTLTWLRDGQPLAASTRFTTTYDLNTGVARLKISDSILNDSATYTVVGENKAGSDRTNGRLEIEKESGVDNKPIVDPNAFAYLNKPQSAPAANVDENGEAFSPARVLLPLSNIHSIEGKAVRLACQVDGNPKPSVIWYKNGIALPASTRLNPTYDFKTRVVSLKIDEAQTNDSGVYQVFVENDYGNDRTESRLLVDISPGIDQSPIVDPGAFKYLNASKPSERPQSTDQDGNKYSPPKVIVPLKDIRVNHGQPATFLSKIVGYPIPSITWLLNNKPLSESSRYTSAYDHTTGLASFKISGTQTNDLGTYTAIAENCVGRDSTTASLHLNQVSLVDTQPIVSPDAFRYLEKAPVGKNEPDEMPGQLKPPKFVVPLKNVSVEEGECATLLAKIDAYPYPSIQWFRNGISLPASTRTLPNYDFNTGLVSLRISDVQLADFGNYTALAQNKIGQDQTQCCLLVKELPGVDSSSMVSPEAFRYLEKPRGQARPLEQSVAYIPPKFIVPLSNVSLQEGQTIYLAGKVHGYPKPKITWFKDGTPVPASTRVTIDFDFSTGVVSLRISDAQMNDIGIFIALAENEAGSDQTQCEVTIQSMPNIDSTPMVNPEAFKYLEQPSYARPKSVDELDELSPPKVIVPLSNVKLQEGQTVILACKIEGYPRPKLTWFKNGLTLPAANRYTTDYDLSTNIATLKIDQALLIDLGDYLVLAENAAGRDQTHCTVFIQQSPNVDSTPMVDPEAFKYLEQAPLRKPSLEDVEDICPPVVIIPLQDIKLTEGEPL
ncbi:titin isoform X1 [Brachionus plicatilis]|uniref:Titin isoform X1 n=1 Tax=Brachionus plicatilis TaxID=10195 RepID=A0A3M7RFI7_BRAPC|nr:titin isoform X1 [Brachionus plicatilis]